MIATWLTSVLAGAGYRTTLAGDLGQARRHLDGQRFDLWLCDLHLPDGLATDLLDRPGRPPAIALTADLDDAARRRLLAAGFDAVLAKPCAPEALLAALDRLRCGMRAARVSAAGAASGADPDPGPPLDDDMALHSCGDQATVRALRELLVVESAELRARLAAPWQDEDRAPIGDELHRLAAAARWCGAAPLARHLAWLRPALLAEAVPDRLRPGLLAQLERLQAALEDWLGPAHG